MEAVTSRQARGENGLKKLYFTDVKVNVVTEWRPVQVRGYES